MNSHLLVIAGALALFSVQRLQAVEPSPPEPTPELTLATNQLTASWPDTNAPLATAVEPAQITLPPALAEVVRLAESGVSDDVILAYIQKTPGIGPLTADQVLYLRDLGISTPVLTALIEAHAAAQPAQPAMEPVPAPTVPQYPEVTNVVENPEPGEENFYGSLAPYGSWIALPGYGWCWRPTCAVVCPTWRPYCDSGYWAWTDCGWYWNSYYSWGWAPFHYGRWCQYPRYGWVWCPDRVWSPAWVCWRQSSTHCGWAPLPPGATFTAKAGWTYKGAPVSSSFGFGLTASSFNFVSYNHLTDRQAYRHRLQGQPAQTAFNETRVNNRMMASSNHRFINGSIDPQRVEASTGRPVRAIPVAELERRRSPAAEILGGGGGPAYSSATFRTQPLVRTPGNRMNPGAASTRASQNIWNSTIARNAGPGSAPETHIAIPYLGTPRTPSTGDGALRSAPQPTVRYNSPFNGVQSRSQSGVRSGGTSAGTARSQSQSSSSSSGSGSSGGSSSRSSGSSSSSSSSSGSQSSSSSSSGSSTGAGRR